MLKRRLIHGFALTMASAAILMMGSYPNAEYALNHPVASILPANPVVQVQATSDPADTGELEKENDTGEGKAQGAERVIHALATHLGVSADDIRTRHTRGFGFGEIFRAYTLAQATNQSVDTILNEHAAGTGWGELYKNASMSPGGHGLGSIMGRGHGKARGAPGAKHAKETPTPP